MSESTATSTPPSRKAAAPQAARLELDVNGEPRSVASPCSVTELLESLDLGPSSGKRVAVAVNRDVILRSRHAETPLADGDRVEILEAVGGG